MLFWQAIDKRSDSFAKKWHCIGNESLLMLWKEIGCVPMVIFYCISSIPSCDTVIYWMIIIRARPLHWLLEKVFFIHRQIEYELRAFSYSCFTALYHTGWASDMHQSAVSWNNYLTTISPIDMATTITIADNDSVAQWAEHFALTFYGTARLATYCLSSWRCATAVTFPRSAYLPLLSTSTTLL